MAPAEWGCRLVEYEGLRKRDALPHDDPYCLFACNYEWVREKQHNRDLQRLMERRRCMLTIDESTAIKNPGTGTYRAVIELAKRAAVVRGTERYAPHAGCQGLLWPAARAGTVAGHGADRI